MKHWGVLFLIAVSWANLANAKITYERYVAKDPVDTGIGGTVTTQAGIEFWTSGSPPRRFEIIGVIVDTRREGWIAGNAIGSSAIAKKAKSVGGDAVIVVTRGSRIEGFSGGSISNRVGNQTYGSADMTADRSVRTSFAVVRYLP